MAHQCRREEMKAKREQKREWFENRWELLRCRVMVYDEERKVVCSTRREAQQLVKC